MIVRDKAALVLQICASNDRMWILNVCQELDFDQDVETLARAAFNRVRGVLGKQQYAEAESRLRSGR